MTVTFTTSSSSYSFSVVETVDAYGAVPPPFPSSLPSLLGDYPVPFLVVSLVTSNIPSNALPSSS